MRVYPSPSQIVSGLGGFRVTDGAQGTLIVGGYSGNSIAQGAGAAPDASAILSGGISGSENKITGGGAYNTIAGGYDQQITSTAVGACTISGGAHHRVSGTATHGTVGGGSSNAVSADYGTVAGGTGGTASNTGATVAGGNANTASGQYANVGGGTSNTASGTSCTVAGGASNTAGGNQSFVAGNSNAAYGSGSVCTGSSNSVGVVGTPANGDYAAQLGGLSNTIGTTASARFSGFAGGRSNNCTVEYGGMVGGREGLVRLQGAQVWSNTKFAAVGDAQASRVVLHKQTTDATATELTLDGTAAGSTTRLALPNDTTWAFVALIVARNTAADTESAGYELKGVIRRGANAAATALVGTITQTVLGEDVAAWDATVTADATNGSLKITVTGEAAKTINWVARVDLVEVTG